MQILNQKWKLYKKWNEVGDGWLGNIILSVISYKGKSTACQAKRDTDDEPQFYGIAGLVHKFSESKSNHFG